MWFAVLKDTDFVFDTENPSRVADYDPNTKEAMINLAYDKLKDMPEDEIINHIIEYSGHESGHEAFDSVTSDYVKENLKEWNTLFTNSFIFYLQEVFSIVLKTDVAVRPDIVDNQLTELKALVETIIERRLLNEVFAGFSGGDESISRVLMERYHLKLADRIKTDLLKTLETQMKFWEDRFKEMMHIKYILDRVERTMLMLIDTLRDFAYQKGSEGLLNAVVKQIKEKDVTEMDIYEKIIRRLITSGKSNILLEYIKTGDFNILKPFARENWEEL